MSGITEVAVPLGMTEAARLDKRIRLMADTIRDNVLKITGLIEEAKTGQIHVALGFASWTAYLADALGGRLELDTDSRREVVALMSGEGMSNRAIAQAVGVSHVTVINDRKSAAGQVVSDLPPVPAAVVDEDHEVMAQVVDELLAIAAEVRHDAAPDAEVEHHVPSDAEVIEEPTSVTGLDGKTYRRKRDNPPRPPAPPTFARLMRKLTELNLLAHECQDIAEGLPAFRREANWNGTVYDPGQQYESTAALAAGFASVVDGIIAAVARRQPVTESYIVKSAERDWDPLEDYQDGMCALPSMFEVPDSPQSAEYAATLRGDA